MIIFIWILVLLLLGILWGAYAGHKGFSWSSFVLSLLILDIVMFEIFIFVVL